MVFGTCRGRCDRLYMPQVVQSKLDLSFGHAVSTSHHVASRLDKLVTDHKVSYGMLVSYCMVVGATLQPNSIHESARSSGNTLLSITSSFVQHKRLTRCMPEACCNKKTLVQKTCGFVLFVTVNNHDLAIQNSIVYLRDA